MTLYPERKMTPERRAEVRKLLLEGRLLPPNPPAGSGLIAKLSNGNFVFPDIPYQGRVVPAVELSSFLLDNGASKTQDGWKDFSSSSPEGWSVPDVELLYQLMKRAYDTRANQTLKPVTQEVASKLREYFDKHYVMTLTRVKYGAGLGAVVSRLGIFPGASLPSNVAVPEFTKATDHWSYLVLAKEQPEQQLGTIQSLPTNARPVLETLLGAGYENAGAVFQYCSSRKNGNLREVRLWTPTAANRNMERVVALGVGNNGRFYLGASGYVDVSRPALGVRNAKNFQAKQG